MKKIFISFLVAISLFNSANAATSRIERALRVGSYIGGAIENAIIFTDNSKLSAVSTFIYDSVTNRMGIGQATPTAKVHIKGATSDDTDFALKIDDSSDSSLFSVRNDGNVYFGTNSIYDGVNDRWGIGVTTPESDIHIVKDGKIQIGTSNAYDLTVMKDPSHTGDIAFFGEQGSGTTPLGGTYLGTRSGHGYLKILSTGGATRFFLSTVSNTDAYINPPNAGLVVGDATDTLDSKLRVIGATADSSAYALKVDDSSNSNLLSVRNDGVITSSGGRVKGYTIKVAIYTITNSDTEIIHGNTDTGAFAFTLPATPTDGIIFHIKNTGTSGNDLTISRNGILIDMQGTDIILLDNEAVKLIYTTSGWKIL